MKISTTRNRFCRRRIITRSGLRRERNAATTSITWRTRTNTSLSISPSLYLSPPSITHSTYLFISSFTPLYLLKYIILLLHPIFIEYFKYIQITREAIFNLSFNILIMLNYAKVLYKILIRP